MNFDWNNVGGVNLPDRNATITTGRSDLGQKDFLTLLTAQLKNQDPTSPLDNAAFVAQLAQFSTVSGIAEMNQSLSELSALAKDDARATAPQWIGRTITDGDGQAAKVAAVSFAPDGGLILDLDSGASIGVAQIVNVA